jgi:HPt (histidine-containing phosphotransfer) domain-containing protein
MSVINTEELLERCMGMASIMESVLAQFHDMGEDMLKDIERQLDAGCWEEAARAAHSLKGASGSISATALNAKAAEMELHARNADDNACRELRPALRREMERCLSEIPTILENCKTHACPTDE